MACPKCGCKEVYVYDDEDDPCDDRLQRCAACGQIFDLDDHTDEEDNEFQRCRGDGMDPWNDHLLPRPECGGRNQA